MAKRTTPAMFRHGELHLVLLALLERQPMHGYQLMGELNRLFAPGYRASPGSVYPAIEALAEGDLLVGADEGGRRVYALTAAGSDALARRLHELAAVEARAGVRLGRSSEAEGSLDRFVARVRAVAPRLDLATLDDALGAAAGRIEQMAADLDNVRLGSYVPVERLSELLATGDIHVVPLRAGLARVSMPSKTYSILAAGRPVLASIDPGTEIPRILAESGGGVAVGPDDQQAFNEALDALLADEEAAKAMGQAGRRWVMRAASPEAVATAYERLVAELGRPR